MKIRYYATIEVRKGFLKVVMIHSYLVSVFGSKNGKKPTRKLKRKGSFCFETMVWKFSVFEVIQ